MMKPPSLSALGMPTAMSMSQLPGRVAGNDATTKQTDYGMSMWFEVVLQDVGGQTKLGRWTSCTGLGVTFATESIASPVSSRSPTLLPTGISFTDITLKRAMSYKDSLAIRRWLNTVAQKWIVDDGEGERYKGTTVLVTLYSDLQAGGGYSKGHRVMEWTLRNVFPKAWKAPNLTASGNEVAIEELTLTHDGFLDPPADPGDPLITVEDTKTNQLLAFDHFKDLAIKKDAPAPGRAPGLGNSATTAGTDATKGPGGAQGVVITQEPTDPEKVNITVSVTLEGQAKAARAQRLLFQWLDFAKKNKEADQNAEPRTLNLVVGRGTKAIRHKVVLRRADGRITRLTSSGIPCRSTYSLTFEVSEGAAAAGGSLAGPSAATPSAPRVSTPRVGGKS